MASSLLATDCVFSSTTLFRNKTCERPKNISVILATGESEADDDAIAYLWPTLEMVVSTSDAAILIRTEMRSVSLNLGLQQIEYMCYLLERLSGMIN